MKLHSIIMSQVTEYSISMKIGLSETSMGLSISINLFGSNYKQTSNHATENKPHMNSVYFVPRESEITIRFSSQMP